MKHLKTYETNEEIEYCVGDIVVCINDDDISDKVVFGEKYLVLNIYDRRDKDYKNYKKGDDFFLYIKDMKIGNSTSGWRAERFINQLKHDVNKYNL